MGAEVQVIESDSESDIARLEADTKASEASFTYVISGLHWRSELNGSRCIAEKVDRTTGRIHVRLPGTCHVLSLKFCNLLPDRGSPAPEGLVDLGALMPAPWQKECNWACLRSQAIARLNKMKNFKKRRTTDIDPEV